MPQALRIRAREYVRNGRELIKKGSYNELIAGLSPDLRADVVLHMSSKTLETVWYLSALEQGVRVELALRLARTGYAPREKISSVQLNVLMRGVAAKAGNILTVGGHWGEDVIVTSMALRDLRPASALTYAEVATLSRSDLDEILPRFPESERFIRLAAMKIAMQRATIIIAEYVRSRRDLASGGQGDKHTRAHKGLTSAFGHTSEPSADPAMILRVITGANLRDIQDGWLVEEVDDDEGVSEHGKVMKELASVKSDVAELKGMMKALLARDGGSATAGAAATAS